MNRFAGLFATMMMASALLAMGCAAETDDNAEAVDEESADLSSSTLGADSNGATLDINYARVRNCKFIGRYISFDGTHPALSLEEANRFRAAKMPLVAIWETGQKRAVETGTVKGQFAAGAADARAANIQLEAVGAHNKVIYFTVDFNVTAQDWTAQGKLITAYFDGINSVIGAKRTGVYGTYASVKGLFDENKVAYGWQQTFGGKGDKVDSRSQLRQYNIYPDQTDWGVSGAGALDLDRAVNGDFGQW
jgi:hypothetical protein